MKNIVFILLIFLSGSLESRILSSDNHSEIIIKLNKSLKKSAREIFFLENDLELKREINLMHETLYVAQVTKKRSLKNKINKLNSLNEVIYSEPNYTYYPTSFQGHLPRDPLFFQQWNLHNSENLNVDVDLIKAWEITKGSKNIKIAVIDTGVNYLHPDLKNNIWVNEKELYGVKGVDDDNNGYIDDIHGYDFFDNDAMPNDKNGHGTHCAGVIGAEHNNIGIAGIMNKVSILPIRFMNDSGTLEGAVKAIDYAIKMKVDIMSNSWGTREHSIALGEIIERANQNGIIFVAAAGNDKTNNDKKVFYPASYKSNNVISVASHDEHDLFSFFSNYGRKTVHVVAPGFQIISTYLSDGYKYLSGTSMAAPHVSGILGLKLALTRELSISDLKEKLLRSSISVDSYKRNTISGGRISAYNLLTDFFPARNIPDNSKWQNVNIGEVFESPHPLDDYFFLEKIYHIPGAKFIRVKIEKYDFEEDFDFLILSNPSTDEIIEKVSGVGSNYLTDYLFGNSIRLSFSGYGIMAGWGFKIKSFEVIY